MPSLIVPCWPHSSHAWTSGNEGGPDERTREWALADSRCSSARIGGDAFVILMVDAVCAPQGKVGIFDELLTEIAGLAS
jgi:hypothetical protein